jgi:GNAT superfamily N-acetyltransferase
MSDMLVKLYTLPATNIMIGTLRDNCIEVRHPLPPEKHIVIDWVRKNFGQGWASECERTFSNLPVSSFIAVKNNTILGFASYNATCKNFFGPTGVCEESRGTGIGTALLLKSLEALREDGYAYAIIGGVGPAEFYQKVAGATIIADSAPGIYKGMLK